MPLRSDLPELVIDARGRWFRVVPDEPVFLGPRRRILRRVLRALAEAAKAQEELTTEHLVSRVWADERLAWSVAQNRLHVSLWTLRQLGLRGILHRTRTGYILAANTNVIEADDPPPLTRIVQTVAAALGGLAEVEALARVG